MKKHLIAPLLALALPLGNGTDATEPQEAPVMVIDGAQLTLGDLLDMAREQLDIDGFVLDDPRSREESLAFVGTAKFAPGGFLAVFEQVLRAHDYLHIEPPAGSTRLHLIARVSAQGGRGTSRFKTMAPCVTTEQARAMHDRQILITTTYTCKSLPARDAVNTLQPYFADSFTDNIRNIEGTSTLVMTGFASTIAGLLDMLDRIDVMPAEEASLAIRPGHWRDLVKEVQSLENRVEALEGKH